MKWCVWVDQIRADSWESKSAGWCVTPLCSFTVLEMQREREVITSDLWPQASLRWNVRARSLSVHAGERKRDTRRGGASRRPWPQRALRPVDSRSPRAVLPLCRCQGKLILIHESPQLLRRTPPPICQFGMRSRNDSLLPSHPSPPNPLTLPKLRDRVWPACVLWRWGPPPSAVFSSHCQSLLMWRRDTDRHPVSPISMQTSDCPLASSACTVRMVR